MIIHIPFQTMLYSLFARTGKAVCGSEPILGDWIIIHKQFTTFNKYFPEYTKPSIVGNAIHEICKDHSGSYGLERRTEV